MRLQLLRIKRCRNSYENGRCLTAVCGGVGTEAAVGEALYDAKVCADVDCLSEGVGNACGIIKPAVDLELVARLAAGEIFHKTVAERRHLSTGNALVGAEGVVLVAADYAYGDTPFNGVREGCGDGVCVLEAYILKCAHIGLAAHVVEHGNVLRAGDRIVRAVSAVGVAVDDAHGVTEGNPLAVAAVGNVGERVILGAEYGNGFKHVVSGLDFYSGQLFGRSVEVHQLKRIAAGKGIFIDHLDVVGKSYALERGATAESILLDRLDAIWQYDGGKRRAVFEYMASHNINIARNINIGKTRTAAEYCVTHTCDAVRNVNFFERGAVFKCAGLNICNSVRNRDFGKTGAACEQIALNGCDPARQCDLGKSGAVLKCAGSNFGNAVRDRHFCNCLTSVKRRAVDACHAVSNNNGFEAVGEIPSPRIIIHLARAGDGQHSRVIECPSEILAAIAALDNVSVGQRANRQERNYHQQRQYKA